MMTTFSFRPLTRIHLLLTRRSCEVGNASQWFPTSDEDSSTPDLYARPGSPEQTGFPTSDEDSSTPDLASTPLTPVPTTRVFGK